MFRLKSRNLKMLATGVMLTLAMGALAGCGGEKKEAAKKDKFNVGIVQIVEHAALDVASKGFVDGMAAKGYKEGENVTYDRQNAQADQSNLHTIAQHFINKKVDLICAVATPAAQVVANATQDIPIVATAVTDYEAAKLIKSNAKPETNVTGTSDMNLVEAQLDLILKLVPATKTVGVIYNSSEVNSQVQVDLLKGFAKDRKVEIKEATVNNVNDIQQAARSLIGQVEAIYVPTDNVLASAMPALAMVTEEAKLPVVSGWDDANGIATIAIDYYKLGVQTGEMAADILSGKAKPQDMPIQTQNEFTELWVVPAETYKQLMDESAPLSNFTNEVMATRFSDVMWLVEQIMWKSFDKRLAAFLLEEASIEGTNELKTTHEIIGNHMGNPREVVTRMLRYFQNEGMVKLSRGTIEITDWKRLEELSE